MVLQLHEVVCYAAACSGIHTMQLHAVVYILCSCMQWLTMQLHAVVYYTAVCSAIQSECMCPTGIIPTTATM